MPNKLCTKCGTEKDVVAFSKAKSCKDGLRGECKACEKLRKDAWRQNNLDHHNKKSKDWALSNPDKRKQSNDKWRAANKVQQAALSSLWKRKNKTKVNLATAMRRRRLREATPSWASKQDIYDIYVEAKYLQLEVDHIIPLQSHVVCGLHVAENLQLLSKTENCRKGNSYA